MESQQFDAFARAFAGRGSRRRVISGALLMALMPRLAWAKNDKDESCDASHKIRWCHCPPGNLNNCHTLCIDRNGRNGHENHDHDCGCDDPDCACSPGKGEGDMCRPAAKMNGQCVVMGDCAAGLVCTDHTCQEPCVPTDCATAGVTCGVIPDGCGGQTTCGNCPMGYACVMGVCRANSCANVGASCVADPAACCTGLVCQSGACAKPCVPVTCSGSGVRCGSLADGCGQTLNCGTCANGKDCIDGQCMASCRPKSCDDLHLECGAGDDGCGGMAWCGSCPNNRDCEHGVCVQRCVPATCRDLDRDCGDATDGCGGTISCGTCGENQVCMGNGRCGSRTPRMCAVEGESCVSNACCVELGCIEGICASGCVPVTCEVMGVACGSMSDGCGGSVDCGSCAAGTTCTAGQCTTDESGGKGMQCQQSMDCETGLVCATDSCEPGPDKCRGIGESCGEQECCGSLLCIDGACEQMIKTCAMAGDDCASSPCCSMNDTCAMEKSGYACRKVPAGEPAANCVHVDGRPSAGERCCDRLHQEGSRCVINRWDHCDQSTGGRRSGCEKGTTCEGGRTSPHHQEVCVPKRQRREVLEAGL